MDRGNLEKNIISDYDPEAEPSFIHEFTIEQSVEKEEKERLKDNPAGTRRNPQSIAESESEWRDRRTSERDSYPTDQQDQAWYTLQRPVRLIEKRTYLENQNELIRSKISADHLEWIQKWLLLHPYHTEQEYKDIFRLSLQRSDSIVEFLSFDIDYECKPERLFLSVDNILPSLNKRGNSFDW